MGADRVVCSRCGKTFESQDDLIYHSIDTHAGADAGASTAEASEEGGTAAADGIDQEMVDRLLEALEAQQRSTGSLRVQYGQRYLAAAGLAVLAIVLVLSYLHLADLVQTAAYMFSLGTLFGLSLSYLQAFVQAARQ